MGIARDHSPIAQVASGNPWYTDDQFAKQMGHPGAKATIENRWHLFERALHEHLFKKGLDKNVRLLDAGSGDGINLFGMKQIIEKHGWDIDLYAIDYNAVRVERVKRLPFVYEVKEGDIQSLPYPDNWFDVIICSHVLEHIQADQSVINELKRVLHPDGILFIGVPNEGCLFAILRNNILQPSIAKSTDHVHFYTFEKLWPKLERAGFLNIIVRRYGFFFPILFLHYFITRFAFGRGLTKCFGALLPSQCADLIFVCQLNSARIKF